MRYLFILLLSTICFGVTEPNIINTQFWGTPDGFIVIEELSPRVITYRSVDPNKIGDFSFTVKNARTKQMNSEAALTYLILHWPTLKMYTFNVLSQHWKPEDKVVVEPNLPIVVEPNTPVEPNQVETIQLTGINVLITPTGSKYHNVNGCPYVTPLTAIKVDLSLVFITHTPCSRCKPPLSE